MSIFTRIYRSQYPMSNDKHLVGKYFLYPYYIPHSIFSAAYVILFNSVILHEADKNLQRVRGDTYRIIVL